MESVNEGGPFGILIRPGRETVVPDTFVMLCDWRGRCVWTSEGDPPAKVGELVWARLSADSQAQAKRAVAHVVTLHESLRLDVFDNSGALFRGWLWPLDSPEMALCLLGLQVPGTIGRLTDRELGCLELLAQGLETRLIAQRLDVSVSTVHTHLKHAREKLGLASIEGLISFAARYVYPSRDLLDGRLSSGKKISGSTGPMA